MNGYERIKAAFDGVWPDKIPVMLHNFLMAISEAGFTHEEYRNDPQKIAETYIRAVEKYSYDCIVVDVDTATLAGAGGACVDFPYNEPARVYKGCLDNINEIKRLRKIDITDYKYVNIWLEAVRILRSYFKKEIYIRGNCDQAPFSLASMLRSTQGWLLDLCDIDNENNINELLEYCTGIVEQFIKLMVEAGAHCVSNGDSPAGPSMISPAMYKKFALPYEKRTAKTTHNLGVKHILHICGDTTAILDEMLETTSDSLELDYKTNILKAYRQMKNKVVFSGNIDPSGIIAFGNTDDVIRETLKLLDMFSDTPKFILCPGCAIPAVTPPGNIHALIETARNYKKD